MRSPPSVAASACWPGTTSALPPTRGCPSSGVTLLYHLGFFRQEIDDAGRQVEHAVHWRPADHLEPLDARVEVVIGGRNVVVGVWRRVIRGEGGSIVPVYFLDTRLEENDPADQAITDQLYAGDPPLRLSQEAVLGLAGPRMLARLGHEEIATYHLNEGHASLVPVALLSERLGGTVADASRRRHRGGAGAVRLHHAHAGAGRPRPVQPQVAGRDPRAGAGRRVARHRLPRATEPST